jgi:type II secretory pathway predicted ATPase ExeA
MFDSRAQRELVHGLALWTELRGLALVTGDSGVGKSISTRRFVSELDEQRFRVIRFNQMPTTATGFLRSLSRVLGLPMRRFAADLFDQIRDYLRADAGPHALLVLDDAEGMRLEAMDLLRRLLCADLDADDRFSVLLAGTDALLRALSHHELAPLRSRIGYAVQLRPFSLEDTQNYVKYQLHQAGGDANLLSDDAVRAVFQASQGVPRRINQVVLHALIHAMLDAAGMPQSSERARTRLRANGPHQPGRCIVGAHQTARWDENGRGDWIRTSDHQTPRPYMSV